MSIATKRSELLRARMASKLEEEANTAAPVTLTGAGMPPPIPDSQNVVRETEDFGADYSRLRTTAHEPSSANRALRQVNDQIEVTEETRKHADSPLVNRSEEEEATSALSDKAANRPSTILSRTSAAQASLKHQPGWEKLSITLEPVDLAILERFHQDARIAGVRMRRGGNPSLFIRAALRLFDEVSNNDPVAWADRVVEVLPTNLRHPSRLNRDSEGL